MEKVIASISHTNHIYVAICFIGTFVSKLMNKFPKIFDDFKIDKHLPFVPRGHFRRLCTNINLKHVWCSVVQIQLSAIHWVEPIYCQKTWAFVLNESYHGVYQRFSLAAVNSKSINENA